jgi:hypothetical protein
MEQHQWLVILVSITFSSISLIVSVWTFHLSYKMTKANLAHSLYAKLLDDLEDFKLLYLPDRQRRYYFSSSSRGGKGNFVGSAEEPRVDRFYEYVNFICMWLLKVKPGKEELLFKKHIARLYMSTFFQEYYSFLKSTGTGEYFPFLHDYARKRFGAQRPNVKFLTEPHHEEGQRGATSSGHLQNP